jgi:hypothetical protein
MRIARHFLTSRPLLLAMFFIGQGLLGLPAMAHDDDAENVQELKQVIDTLQSEVESQKAKLDSQSQALLKLQEQMQSLIASDESPESAPNLAVGADPHSLAVADADAEKARVTAQASAQKPVSALADESRYDQNSPSGANTSILGPAATIKIANGKTEIGVHGMLLMQVMYDTNRLDSNEFDAFLIPVDGAPSDTRYSVNPSRLGFSSRSATGWGVINTHASMDLNGDLAEAEWRLRQFYGEIINDDKDYAFLVGQAYATALDLKSVPETLDFAGPSGYFARRQPLLRFSKLFDHKFLLDIATDTPNNSTFLDADNRARRPDFVVAGEWLTDGQYLSHIRLAGMLRDLRAEETTTGHMDSESGWALVLSGKVNLPALGDRDSFKFGVTYGDGYGAQVKSGPYDAAFDPVTSELEAIGVFTTYGGLQHFWTNSWRSNLVFGYTSARNPTFMEAERLDSTTYLAGNIIWTPWKPVTFGFEYLYGRRENVDGASNNSSRFLFSSRFTF